jgi:hypothetical protein
VPGGGVSLRLFKRIWAIRSAPGMKIRRWNKLGME